MQRSYKKVTAKIPIKLYWESEAVRLWWILSQQIDTIKIKCKPDNLPKFFKANIKKLVENTDRILVSDLEWIENIELLIDKSWIVAWILIPRAITSSWDSWEDSKTNETTEWSEWEAKSDSESKWESESKWNSEQKEKNK